jgi:WD40 repeat protein
LETGKLISTISTKHSSNLGNATISANGQYFALWGHPDPKNASVTIWDTRNGRQVSDLKGIGRENATLIFASDGKCIIGSLSPLEPYLENATLNRIVVWDTASGNIKHQMDIGKSPAQTLTLSKDGRIIAAGIGTSIRLYNAESLHSIGTISSGVSPITSLAISPNNKQFASGHENGTIKLWNLNTRKLIITMQGFGSTDNKKVSPDWLIHSPDGRYNWSKGAVNLIKWRYKGQLYPIEKIKKQMRSN